MRKIAFSVLEKKTISGSMVQAHVVLAQRFILTAVKNTAVANRDVPLAVNVIVILRSGIMYLHSLKTMEMAIMKNLPRKTLTPEWVWSVWLP